MDNTSVKIYNGNINNKKINKNIRRVPWLILLLLIFWPGGDIL